MLCRYVSAATLPAKAACVAGVVRLPLEEMSTDEQSLIQALNLTDIHSKPLKIDGVSVYK